MQLQPDQATRRLYTINQIVTLYPALTVGGLRDCIFYNKNGFEDRCVIRIGRKVMIDADALDEWLNEHRGAA